MNHLVLLGDSVFDNARYVNGGLAVIDRLQDQLPEGWKATLLAIDGNVTTDVPRQIDSIPDDATHLVVSMGGNDALNASGILSDSADSVAEVLGKLAVVSQTFERNYLEVLGALQRRKLPLILCTIYYPRFPDPYLQKLAVTALTIFNDVIVRAAFSAGAPLLDLRLICNEDADYANEIEPSAAGGEKITRAIWQAITEHDFSTPRTAAFAGE
jgi:lysophospholipase L1-like esterase